MKVKKNNLCIKWTWCAVQKAAEIILKLLCIFIGMLVSKVVHPNEAIVFLVLMLLYSRALSCRRTLSHHPNSPDLVPSDNYLFGLLKGGFKRQTWQWQRSENCSDEVAQRTINRILRGMGRFKGGALPWKETVNLLRSRGVIHRALVSFWYMIHFHASVIIPVLKKKALLFDSLS